MYFHDYEFKNSHIFTFTEILFSHTTELYTQKCFLSYFHDKTNKNNNIAI